MKKMYVFFLCLGLVFGANVLTPQATGLRLTVGISQYQSLEEDAEKMCDDKAAFCERRFCQLQAFLSCEENFSNSCSVILKKLDGFLPDRCTTSEQCWLSLARSNDEMVKRVKALMVMYYHMRSQYNEISMDLSWSCRGRVDLSGYIHRFDKKGRL